MNKTLTKFPASLLLLISLLSLSACNQMTPFQAVTETAGAGDVYRADSKVNALIPAGATIEKLAGGFAFTEGPVWHQRLKHLMFSDLRSNAIHLWVFVNCNAIPLRTNSLLVPVYRQRLVRELSSLSNSFSDDRLCIL